MSPSPRSKRIASKPKGARPGGPRLDALFLHAWRRQLEEAAGMRIQKIFQPEASTIVLRGHPTPGGEPLTFRVRSDGYLAFSDPGLENPQEPTSFCMQLRKHLVGGFLRQAEQPTLDRVLVLSIERRSLEGDGGMYRLVFELLGTRPNLFLVAPNGRILGSTHRYSSDKDRFGKERQYNFPDSPGSAPEPKSLEDAELEEIFSSCKDAKELARSVSGVSRPLAEVLQSSKEPVSLLRSLLQPDTGIQGPFRSVKRGKRLVPLAGGPEQLDLEGWEIEEHRDLVSLTVSVFEEAASEDREERTLQECRKALHKVQERLTKQLARNLEARENCSRADEMRALGELLKVNLGQIKPGDKSIRLTDYSTGVPVEKVVSLDVRKKPLANMDHYFTRAKRLQAKLPMLERKSVHLKYEAGVVEKLMARLDEPGLSPQDFKEELRAAGILDSARNAQKPKAGKQKKEKKSGKEKRELRTFVSSDGLRILVGRNNKENDYLVKKAGKKGDAWLHAEGCPGAHVLVKLSGGQQRPPRQTLEEAAQLAAHFSHQRYEAKAKVMLSQIGIVKKAPGAAPGQVIVPKHETIVVPTDPEVIRRLSPVGSR